ncbi:hypothetical protein RIR_e25158_A0A2N1MVM8_9GLOM [Rhizophagus irregularis DAOM 181602=DAOM 197198]|nr:hypothetical protein RIR_e25158_A0A2N1MVM8_9GLOM [Rhizophagus irregularis DAOM 181602=DAOM 197198]
MVTRSYGIKKKNAFEMFITFSYIFVTFGYIWLHLVTFSYTRNNRELLRCTRCTKYS